MIFFNFWFCLLFSLLLCLNSSFGFSFNLGEIASYSESFSSRDNSLSSTFQRRYLAPSSSPFHSIGLRPCFCSLPLSVSLSTSVGSQTLIQANLCELETSQLEIPFSNETQTFEIIIETQFPNDNKEYRFEYSIFAIFQASGDSIIAADCGNLQIYPDSNDLRSLQITFNKIESTSKETLDALQYQVCQATSRETIEMANAQMTCSDPFRGKLSELQFETKVESTKNYFTVVALRSDGQKVARYNIVPYEFQKTSFRGQTLWKFFILFVSLISILLTCGWIVAHFSQNFKLFKFAHVVRTTFPPSFVVPRDLKMTRLILLAASLLSFICGFISVFMGGISFFFIFTPFLGIICCSLFSPLFTLLYLLFNLICVITSLTLAGTSSFSTCEFIDVSQSTWCYSYAFVTSALFFISTLVLLLFEFLAYAFLVKLLRFKLWLIQNSLVREPQFDYHNLDERQDSFSHPKS